MPNFTAASAVKLHHIRHDQTVVYSATIDRTWGFNGIPHGGYLLAVILRALIAYQTDSPALPRTGTSPPALTDPLSLQAQYLLPTAPGPVEIHVSTVRAGRTFSNVQARLLHNTGGDNPGTCTIMAQAVFTRFPPLPPLDATGHHPPPREGHMNILPLSDSPYAVKSPLETHPSRLKFSQSAKWKTKGARWSKESALGTVPGMMDWVEDPVIARRRDGREDGKQLVVEWGTWWGMMDPEDAVDAAMLAMFADVAGSQPEFLPVDQRPASSYFPTLTMSIQFHASFPPPTPYLSDPHTLGIYCPGGSPIHVGRHEQRVEVWTAPSPVGQGKEQEGWRKKSMCLLTATQTALTGIAKSGGRL